MHYWEESYGSDGRFSVQHIRGMEVRETSQCIIAEMSVCLITGCFNLNGLVKVEYARFLHCKITIFLFVIKKYFFQGGRYFETAISSFSNFCLLISASVRGFFLKELSL